jgi:hypothetical protein
MQHPAKALWRIEFRTNLTRADAPIIRVGYLLEAHWQSQVRWLGLLFRRRLTVPELDKVNVATWPELKDLEPFMKGLFEQAWTTSAKASAAAAIELGSTALAAKYEQRSALHFAAEKRGPDLQAFDGKPVDSFPSLYAYLLGLREDLKPTIVAPVVPLRKAPAATVPVVATPDLELMNQAA